MIVNSQVGRMWLGKVRESVLTEYEVGGRRWMICLVQTWSQNYRPHHCVVRVGFVVTAFQRQAVPACTGSSVTPSGRDLAELRSRNVTEERLKITDTVILASHDDPRTAAQHLWRHLKLTQDSLKKMENKNKRNEISPHHIHVQKRTMPTGHNQQRRNTDCRSDKITRHALGPQAKLEGPHCYEEKANWAQSKRILLAT